MSLADAWTLVEAGWLMACDTGACDDCWLEDEIDFERRQDV